MRTIHMYGTTQLKPHGQARPYVRLHPYTRCTRYARVESSPTPHASAHEAQALRPRYSRLTLSATATRDRDLAGGCSVSTSTARLRPSASRSSRVRSPVNTAGPPEICTAADHGDHGPYPTPFLLDIWQAYCPGSSPVIKH